MSFDFFGKKPEKFGSVAPQEIQAFWNLSLKIGSSSFLISMPLPVWISQWIYNYYENYLQARWPRGDRYSSMPIWLDQRMMRFDLLRPLHHGSYDYAHEFFCATIYPVQSLWFAVQSLFAGLLLLTHFDIAGALCGVAELCAALMFICYSVLTSCLGLIIRPLLSIPMACKKVIESLLPSTDLTRKACWSESSK